MPVYVDHAIQGGKLDGWGFGGGIRHYYRQPKGIDLALKSITDRVATACTTAGGCQYTSPRTITGTVSYRW